MKLYADFSAGRPGAAALKAKGFTGVIRYVGVGSSGKRLTAAEYQDYVAHDVDVLLVFEVATNDVAGGYSRGMTYAQLALEDARRMGVPDHVKIFAACDSHLDAPKGVTVANAVAYMRGAVAILGRARAGYYGFDDTLHAVKAADIVDTYWLCGTKPSTGEAEYVDFWQDNSSAGAVNIGGISVDLDRVYAYEDNDVTEESDGFDVATVNQADWDASVWAWKALLDGSDVIEGGPNAGDDVALNRRINSLGSKLDTLTTNTAAFHTDIVNVVRAQPTGGQLSVDDMNMIATQVVALIATKLKG